MPKKLKYGIILCVLLVIGFAGYAVYKKGNYSQSFIKEINRNLSPENRKIFEDRVTEADKNISEAKTDEDRYSWMLQKGYNQEALGMLAAARETFEGAIKLIPHDYRGYAALFQVESDQGDNDGALGNIKTALQYSPANSDLWRKYAQFMIDKVHASNDQVSALYSEAVVKTNSNIDVITAYATWLESVGNLQAAKEYWQKAIEIYPTNKKTYQAEVDRLEKLLKQVQ